MCQAREFGCRTSFGTLPKTIYFHHIPTYLLKTVSLAVFDIFIIFYFLTLMLSSSFLSSFSAATLVSRFWRSVATSFIESVSSFFTWATVEFTTYGKVVNLKEVWQFFTSLVRNPILQFWKDNLRIFYNNLQYAKNLEINQKLKVKQ